MKIGIITFHASLNCGSMLQAYALQNILERKYKNEVEIINYSNFGQRNYYSNWDWYPRPKVLINDIKLLFNRKYINKTRFDYNQFMNDYFNLSGKLIKKRKDLEKFDGKYDIIIAGGDQVWNVRCRDHDEAYFLSFVNKSKKVAYSPSLGARNINSECKNPEKYRDLINKFDFLSVRETNGQKWLKELTGKDIPIIADPTLLLSKEDWLENLPTDKINEKFIVFYAFSYANKHNNEIMKKITEMTGMPIYLVDGKSYTVNKLEKYGYKLYKTGGPLGLLSLINNASLVLVQSFHGIIFSALFHKTFWSLRNIKINNSNDDRARCILKQTGLESRAITYDDLLNVDLFEKVDYAEFDKNIVDIREKAFKYIESFLED